jgi:pSer/pThr/pTyr-binding forkhead associated (FHA) protein
MGKLPDAQAQVVARLEQQDTRTGAINSIELLPNMTIGRSRECSIFLEDLAVSRVHATVQELTDGNFELLDNHSATGTFVNGQAIARRTLHTGDLIQIGEHQFVFRHLKGH